MDTPVTIHLYKSDNPAISVPLDMNDKNGWLPLLDVDLSQSDLVITESDISSYDWETQILVLNSDVIERFEYRTLANSNIKSFAYAYFILALGDEPVVGGGILPQFSAVGSWIPILFISHTIENPEISSENTNLEMVLRQHSFFHVEAETSFIDDLNGQVRRRLLEIGKLYK